MLRVKNLGFAGRKGGEGNGAQKIKLVCLAPHMAKGRQRLASASPRPGWFSDKAGLTEAAMGLGSYQIRASSRVFSPLRGGGASLVLILRLPSSLCLPLPASPSSRKPWCVQSALVTVGERITCLRTWFFWAPGMLFPRTHCGALNHTDIVGSNSSPTHQSSGHRALVWEARPPCCRHIEQFRLMRVSRPLKEGGCVC